MTMTQRRQPMTIKTVSHRPNGHDTHRNTGITEAQYPYCGQSISRQEFRKIQARIEGEERARIAKVEQSLKERFVREKALAEAKATAVIEKAKKDAAKAAEAQIKAVRASQEEAITQRLAAQRATLEKKGSEAVAA